MNIFEKLVAPAAITLAIVTVVAGVKYCQNNNSEYWGGKPQTEVASVEVPVPTVKLGSMSVAALEE